jgi:hypothetical protein
MSYLFKQIASETKCIPGCYNISENYDTCCRLHDLIKKSISRTVIPSKPICLYDSCTTVAEKGQITCYIHKALFNQWFYSSFFDHSLPLCNWNNCENVVQEGNYSMCCSSEHSELYHKNPLQMSVRCNYPYCMMRPAYGKDYCCDDHKIRKEYYDEGINIEPIIDQYEDPYRDDSYIIDDYDYDANIKYQQEQARLRQITRALTRRANNSRTTISADFDSDIQIKDFEAEPKAEPKVEAETKTSNSYIKNLMDLLKLSRKVDKVEEDPHAEDRRIAEQEEEDRRIAEQEALDIQRAQEMSKDDAQRMLEEQERRDLELAEQLSREDYPDSSENENSSPDNSNQNNNDASSDELPELESEEF